MQLEMSIFSQNISFNSHFTFGQHEFQWNYLEVDKNILSKTQ